MTLSPLSAPRLLGCLALAALLAMPSIASAQSVAEVEIDNDPDLLTDELRDPDPDIADTFMIFTSQHGRRAIVRCVARDKNGVVVGRSLTRVPAHGLRYVRASQMSNGVDFIGSVNCRTRGRVIPTTVFLGPVQITDLKARRVGYRLNFPVVAHY